MADDDRDLRLDKIYDEVNSLMNAGCFEKISDLLEGVMDGRGLHDPDVVIMLAYLTVTLPAKSKIDSRPAYFKAVRTELIRRCAEGRQDLKEMLVDTTLGGLE